MRFLVSTVWRPVVAALIASTPKHCHCRLWCVYRLRPPMFSDNAASGQRRLRVLPTCSSQFGVSSRTQYGHVRARPTLLDRPRADP